MLGFRRGDVIAAYLKSYGFVGIGQVIEAAKPIREVSINGTPMLNLPLRCKGMCANVASNERCEYVCMVEWKCAVDRDKAKWKSRSGLYTTMLVRASLEGQPETVEFLEREFSISLRKFML